MSPDTKPQDPLADLGPRLEAQGAEAIAALTRLAQTYSPEAVLAGVVVVLMMRPIGGGLDRGTVPARLERLAYYLWRADSPGSAEPTAGAIGQAAEASEQLVHSSLLAAAVCGRHTTELDTVLSGLLIDAHVVRGSAYPEQTRQEIVEIFGVVDNELRATLGASATELAHLVWAIGQAQERRAKAFVDATRAAAAEAAATARPSVRRGASKRQRRASAREGRRAALVIGYQLLGTKALTDMPVSPSDCRLPDGTTPTDDAWRVLQSLIGLTVTTARGIRDVLHVRTRPLFVLHDLRVLLADPGNALDSLWDALETYAKRRPPIYDAFQSRRHVWLEERTAECLTRVFGPNAVFRNLVYPDPDRPGGMAELDAAAVWGPFFVIVEVKAAHFRLGAQLGNVGMLRDDLRDNVEHAFEQALRARRYLRSVDTAEYREKHGGRVLRVRVAELERVYLVTVSLHFLGRPIGRLAKLRALGLMTHGEYPWAISASELDIVTRFTEGPDVLLHYLEQRHGIEMRGEFPMADDIDLFGAYLATRLNDNDINAQMPDATFVHLEGFQEQFDAWFAATRNGAPAPDIRLRVPDEIRAILTELRRGGSDRAASWMAFAILSLSSAQLHALASGFREAWTQMPPPGQYRRIAHAFSGLAVLFVVAADGPLESLRMRTATRAAVEKYVRRTPRCIAFGIHRGLGPRPFHVATWLEGAWVHDEGLEALLEQEHGARAVQANRLPGPNDPCVCGRPRKFKHCCAARLR